MQIPHDIMPKTVMEQKEGLQVTCESLVLGMWTRLTISGDHEDHESFYPWEWLQRHKPKSSQNKDTDTDQVQEKDT